jgi:plastocyanin
VNAIMRRVRIRRAHRVRCVLAACALVSVAMGACVCAGAVGAATHSPARLLVYAQEWSLWPSRPALPSGRVVVQLWNRGQDAHDLHVRALSRSGRMIGRPQTVAVTLSGAVAQSSWHLTPGRYELYCSMPGHRARGMHAVIVVR